MEIDWTEDHQKTVDEVLDYLQSPEFLAFPDFSQPFVVACDASECGLGAVLYQKLEGKPRPISYASRTLNEAERKYHMHSGKLEFLGLKWAVCEKFSDYLCTGERFTVYTDNNPLTYVMSTAKLNATGYRWVAELSNYNFDIKYRPGRVNGDADALSRRPMDLDSLEKVCTSTMKLEQLDKVITANSSSDPPTCHNIDVNLLELVGEGKQKRHAQVNSGNANTGNLHVVDHRRQRFPNKRDFYHHAIHHAGWGTDGYFTSHQGSLERGELHTDRLWQEVASDPRQGEKQHSAEQEKRRGEGERGERRLGGCGR